MRSSADVVFWGPAVRRAAFCLTFALFARIEIEDAPLNTRAVLECGCCFFGPAVRRATFCLEFALFARIEIEDAPLNTRAVIE